MKTWIYVKPDGTEQKRFGRRPPGARPLVRNNPATPYRQRRSHVHADGGGHVWAHNLDEAIAWIEARGGRVEPAPVDWQDEIIADGKATR